MLRAVTTQRPFSSIFRPRLHIPNECLAQPPRGAVTFAAPKFQPAAESQAMASGALPEVLFGGVLAGVPLAIAAAASGAAEDPAATTADLNASVSKIQQNFEANTNQAVDQAVAGASTVPPVVTGLVVFSPLILYGIFVAYRAKLNPKATLLDFAFIIAAVVIVLNLISILLFKVRLF